MLIVMEDWNGHNLLQFLLNVEAVWRLDIFEIDASVGGCKELDTVDEIVRVGCVHTDVNRLNAGELIEEHGLALHHRLARQRTEVAKAEDGRSVGDNGHRVSLVRVLVRGLRVLRDLNARHSDTRRVSQ